MEKITKKETNCCWLIQQLAKTEGVILKDAHQTYDGVRAVLSCSEQDYDVVITPKERK